MTVTKQLVVTGKALTSWVWCNQLPELAKNTKDTLGIIAYPGDPSHQWARAALYLAASSTTKHKTVVVDVINFLVNDAEAGKILGTERGLPANTEIRTTVALDDHRREHEDVHRRLRTSRARRLATLPMFRSRDTAM